MTMNKIKRYMREIKFRAWYKKTEEMFLVSAEMLESRNFELFISDCILMQYTGLKDKNEKEIYEGDLLWNGSYLSHNGKKAVGEVSWFIEHYRLYPNVGSFEKLEIAGNIYENPGLL